MHKKFGMRLAVGRWATTMTYMLPQTRSCWQTCSRTSERFARRYGLDPAHYYSAPGLSWDALLKTGVELELLTDMDMHWFIERGMRGSISMVSKQQAKANNPLVEGYDPAELTNYITFILM